MKKIFFSTLFLSIVFSQLANADCGMGQPDGKGGCKVFGKSYSVQPSSSNSDNNWQSKYGESGLNNSYNREYRKAQDAKGYKKSTRKQGGGATYSQ